MTLAIRQSPPPPLDEERVLAASVLEGQLDACLAVGLRAQHFHSNVCRWVFAAACALRTEGIGIDLLSVTGWIERHGHMPPGGKAEIADIYSHVPVTIGSGIVQHAEPVMTAARAREGILAMQRCAAELGVTPFSANAVLTEFHVRLGDLLAQKSSASAFAPMPPAFICEPDPDVDWLVEELGLSAGPPVLFAGYGYSGKTTAAQALALAVASGTKAFGWFAVGQGRTLHLDYEQGLQLTKKKYRRLAVGSGVDIRSCANDLGFISFPRMRFDDQAAESELCRACEGVKLLIVDSLRVCAPTLDENSSEMRGPLDLLTRVSEKTGVVPLVIHHARKPSKEDPPGSRYGIRGSAAIFDGCASVFVLDGVKDEAKRVVHEKDRMRGMTHEDFYLQVEDVEVDGNPKAGLRVAARSEEAAHPKLDHKAEFEGKVKLVLDFIQRNPGAPGKHRIAAIMKMRPATVGEAIDTLIERGEVQDLGDGKPHRPKLHCKAPASPEKGAA